MRILLTTDTVGGVWTYALELARALVAHRMEVVLATMGAPLRPDQAAEAAEVAGMRVEESAFQLEWMHDPWDDVRRAGDWLLTLEERYRPDLVHLNGYAHGALPWKAPVLMVGHSCVLSWWEAVRREAAPAEWARYREEVRRGLQAADLVVAPTRAMLEALETHYGRLRNRCVVPNGRDPALFRPMAKQPYAFAAGRLWDEAKNIRSLDAIAGELPWPVYVAGNERHPDGGEVTYGGARPLGCLSFADMQLRMGGASIYALPARYEPFGLSALEAAFAGCALVLGDIPSLREVWGDAALFVPPDDVVALRQGLRHLMEEPAARAALAGRARTRAFEYTPQRMAAGYLAAYRALVDTGEVPAQDAEEAVHCVS